MLTHLHQLINWTVMINATSDFHNDQEASLVVTPLINALNAAISYLPIIRLVVLPTQFINSVGEKRELRWVPRSRRADVTRKRERIEILVWSLNRRGTKSAELMRITAQADGTTSCKVNCHNPRKSVLAPCPRSVFRVPRTRAYPRGC